MLQISSVHLQTHGFKISANNMQDATPSASVSAACVERKTSSGGSYTPTNANPQRRRTGKTESDYSATET